MVCDTLVLTHAGMESALVGGLLLDPEELPKAVALVKPQDIQYEPARIVYESIKFVGAAGPVDAVLVRNDLEKRGLLDKVGGTTGLASFTDAAITGAHVQYYAEQVADAAQARRQGEAVAKAYLDIDRGEKTSAVVARLLSDLDSARAMGGRQFHPQSIADIIQECLAADGEPPAITTGYPQFDILHGGGLCVGDLTIIGAAPSVGKSQFLANLEARMKRGDERARVLHVSLEMPKRDVVARHISLLGLLPIATARTILRQMERGYTRDNYGWKFDEAVRAASRLPVDIEHGSFTPDDLRALAARYEGRIDVMAVDYLQRIAGGKGQKTLDRVAEACAACKDIALTYGIHVIAVSSLNREGYRPGSRPSLSSLRETGDIEFDADNVWLLWREKAKGVTTEDMELHIEKQRNGPLDMVPFRYELETGVISEIRKREDQ